MTHDPYAGLRIRLISMPDDPYPLPSGCEGTVLFSSVFNDARNITVQWDHGHGLNLVSPPDLFVILPEDPPIEEDYF
jgi:hypothetical protein